jgi:glycerol-3-phosphate dehydrogenase
MASRRTASRFLRPLAYAAGAGAVGGAVLYVSYRPRDIPGSEPAAVPPPIYGERGIFRLPDFPRIKSREEQIAELKRSSGDDGRKKGWTAGVTQWFGGGGGSNAEMEEDEDAVDDDIYDLLVIGGGATGSGIALDAATRGLRVAVVERDDFSSGTSSKSTKLVHGGVRYLEKAVWEMDYSQYVP